MPDAQLDRAQLVADVAQLPQRLELRIGLRHALEGLAPHVELAGIFLARPTDPLGREPLLEARMVPVPAVLVVHIDAVHVDERHHAVADFPPGCLVGELRKHLHVDRNADVLGARQCGDGFASVQSDRKIDVRKQLEQQLA